MDLVPAKNALSNEPIPKSVSRVLDATKIRADYHSRKRKAAAEDAGESTRQVKRPKVKTPTIKDGESMQHFNKYEWLEFSTP